MRYSVIDTGSNTIRLGVYEYENNILKLIHNEAIFANLAGFICDKSLTDEGILVAINSISKLIKIAKRYDTVPSVFATAAIRNAKNSKEISKKIELALGINIDILSGEEEAIFSFYGAAIDFPCNSGVMADVGGGSSEIILFNDKKPVFVTSVPLGSLKAYKTFVSGNIPTHSEFEKIKKYISDTLISIPELKNVPQNNLCLTGGGVDSAVSLSEKFLDTNKLTASGINKMIKKILDDTTGAEKILKDIDPNRALTISPALAIYSQIGEFFRAENVFISAKGIKEGYIYNKMIK